MKGKYRGYYRYDNERIRNYTGFEKTFFDIVINEVDNENFYGIAQDDKNTGGQVGTGVIIGTISGDNIFFTKQMSKASSFGIGGKVNMYNTKGPKIHYTGVRKQNGSYIGRWKLNFSLAFNGIIPTIILPTTGEWEMQIEE
ncbi:MAG: hypothetical protein ABI199_01965 [Bacteroidia bacterium]